ncbi:multiple coagulation factor deficiency protein 2 homolog isoform X3 [Toxorhynchites rutilus septentrionalis]|uniref:multiple coagulation factor deficiency protein 2 homolog isoform X3 n=1 Tax=Toxorhynchites rutilus septentrionalis TaxID=329112 RepID=UPI002479BC71|nr:multiple coagulation factor deficiency protein 2 homolog isoform X3 [Toxorhynchites rutilus septentrionalis]
MKQLALTLGLFAVVTLGQRVVPGVNPNQYQQQQQQQQYHPPPQQQYQQVPQQQMHYQQQQQQVHYQQQQVPVQQQQQYQQVPVQQQHHQQQQPQHTPQQHGDHGVHHGQQQQVLNPNNIQHEKQHIAEHMEVPIDTSKMSEQELQFHYFKMHDSDNNNKLDGCELIKSLIHWHDDAQADGGEGHKTESHPQDDATLQSLVDPILDLMDKDHDGFVSYPEYRQAEAAMATDS